MQRRLDLSRSACLAPLALVLVSIAPASAEQPSSAAPTALERAPSSGPKRQFSGVWPHLATFNGQGECGTGAVVPWAGRLWWITYSPHEPRGSDDRLWAADESLDLWVFPGSVGGTPANRMIHRETDQLLIGPYVIDANGDVRVIPPAAMPGRLTGTARHLTEPATKVVHATMEEGFYEVDLRTLAIRELFPDAHSTGNRAGDLLPGYHGKGLYSGQGRLVYANNGEPGRLALERPDIESGALAEWDGRGDWRVVSRSQFTEVSGPGGIHGNDDPENDPLWSIGWDHRSLVLMLLDGGEWHRFRLPKASHSYDGAHGWNTEWPRIRDIGEDDLLMTMHGTLWRFPRTFRQGSARGIEPRSTYLKVVADFCRWGDQVVFACDDAAKNEFLNTRRAKGEVAGPAQSQSNLWFVEPERLDRLGPAIGRGALWVDEEVRAGARSDAYLFGGFDHRGAHLAHDAPEGVTFRFEVDRSGDGVWTMLEEVTVGTDGYAWHEFPLEQRGAWIRASVDRDCTATLCLEYREADRRTSTPDGRFAGLLRAERVPGGPGVGALLRAGARDVGLEVLATRIEGGESTLRGYHELRPDLSLARVDDAEKGAWMARHVAIPRGVLRLDGNAVLYVDDDGTRYRLPIGDEVYCDRPALFDAQRTSREACTERDLFQCAGTFYELPARNAGGFARIRPIATHPFFVEDYASWRGLLALSGTAPEAPGDAAGMRHIIRSDDGACAVWIGVVDDLWSLGKPRGRGGPWHRMRVEAGEVSDPYLMAGFDRKSLTLESDATTTIAIEVDISGAGLWKTYRRIEVAAAKPIAHVFPDAFQAYWVRLRSSGAATISAELAYE